MRLISLMWVMLAGVSFSIGVLGIFLPLLPTTVFMLMAVYCASKGSPRFEVWIRSRHYVGPLLITWEQERAIPWLLGQSLRLLMSKAWQWWLTRL